MQGIPVHGERIVDGNAATLTVLSLFKAGQTDAYTLPANVTLRITDVFISVEATNSDFMLVADSAAAGKYVASGHIFEDANTTLSMHFQIPYTCPKGVVPKFAGGSSNKSVCIIQGFVDF